MDEHRKRQRLAYLLSPDIIFPGVICKALCMQVSKCLGSRSALPEPMRISVCDESLLII